MKIIKNNLLFYKCYSCKKIKSTSEFYKNKSYRCKLCFKEHYKKNKKKLNTYYQKNKEIIKKRYEKNKSKISKYYYENSEKIKKRVYDWKQENKDKVRVYKLKEKLRSSSDIKKKSSLW